MARRYYLDSSAYLCMLLGEKGHQQIAEEISGGEVTSSVLLVLEVSRNLVRLSREGTLTVSQLQECMVKVESDLDQIQLRELTLDLCRGRVMPVVSTPRSLDLVHLRTALWFHEREKLSRFVTLDGDQALAARELGLPV